MLLCKNYRSFWFGRNLCSTYSDIQLFRLQVLHLLFEELLSENVRRGEGRIVGERSCPCLHSLMSKNHRSWGLVGRRFPETCADPLSPDRNKRLDVTGLFLALKQREGWRNSSGRFVLCWEVGTGHALVQGGCSSSGPAPHILLSQFCCPACLSATAFWLFLYTVKSSLQPVPSTPVSLEVCAGGFNLFYLYWSLLSFSHPLFFP